MRKPAALILMGLVLAVASACAREPRWRAELEEVGIQFISARTLKAMMERGDSFVVVDARDEVHYRNGRIPGAISIPAEDAPLAAVDIRRPKRLLYPERLPADRRRRLVFYCGGPT